MIARMDLSSLSEALPHGRAALLRRFIPIFATLLLVLFSLSSRASVPLSGRSIISGIEYVQADDWARARNFTSKWTIPREEMRLSSPSSSILLNKDSRKISINGIQIWLSFPVAFRNGTLWISSLDVATSINPALFAPRTGGAQQSTTICLDPGHGGKDPGNREGKQLEKNYNLLLAREVRSSLMKAGFRVILTRSSDRFIDLGDRARWAKQNGADLFISLHFNSADGPGGAAVNGIEVYCLTPAGAASTNSRGEGATGASIGNRFDAKNMHLAYQLQKSLVRQLGAEDRGVKRARYAVLRLAEIPSVLIEGGFMTHAQESRNIYSSAYRQQMAKAITDATVAYKKAVEP
jgi:N-acetylmuramoyl-L-alanine amidase